MNKVQKFRGRTPGEAMKKAREALGEEARLVHARRVSGPDDPVPAYEVTATAGVAAEAPADALAGIRRDLEELKGLLHARAAAPAVVAAAEAASARRDEPDREEEGWIDRLRRRGMTRSPAERMVREAEPGKGTLAGSITEAVTAEIAAHADARRLGARSTIVVGPTGSGKTTTIAKLAAELVQRGVRPILVTTDGESVTGEDALTRVAHALELRIETAFFTGQLSALAERLSRRDILLVDTPGRAPWSADGLDGLAEIVRAVDDAEVLLVLPAGTDGDEARALSEAFGTLGVHRVVLTKLDELARPARLVDLVRAMGRPLAWVTSGRESRGAAFDPTDPALAARLLRTAGSVEAQA